MKHTIAHLAEKEKLLYTDLCESNSIVPRILLLTQKQIDLLVSLSNRIQLETSPSGRRLWKVIDKKKHG